MTNDLKKLSILLRIGLEQAKSKEARLPSDIELIRNICQNGFLEFCLAVKPGFTATKFHILLCNKFQNIYDNVKAGIDQRDIFEVQPQIGKELDDNTLVPTPLGFKKHGDLKIGDQIFSPTGKIITVKHVFKPTDLDDIEITFLGGQKVVCHENHEWVVYDHGRHKYRTIEAKELLKTALGGGQQGSTYRFKVDYAKALEMPSSTMPLHPYVLGAWLGDGCTTSTDISHHPNDVDVIKYIEKLGYIKTNFWTHKTTGVVKSNFKLIRPLLKQINVFKNKHIPDQYIWTDKFSRQELLCGLMDTDGTIDSSRGYNRYFFSNTNKKLIDSVAILVKSLGYRTSISKIEPCLSSSGIQGKSAVYNLSFSIHDDFIPFKMQRKAIKCIYKSIRRRRAIISVKKVSPRKGRCIQVNSSDGLYLVTEDFIPTHNSTIGSELFPAWVLGKEEWPIICASYGADLAQQKSSNCRDIVNSDIYRMIFPEVRLHPETSAKDYWKTTTGGSYRAVGVGGGLTGMSGKILICDDPIKDRADADSPTVRESTHKWWEAVFMTRKQDKSAVILINTRWHRDDVSGHLQDKQDQNEAAAIDKRFYDQWQIFCFPAFAQADEYIDAGLLFKGTGTILFRKSGEVLCPERFSYESMMKTMNNTETYDWSSLYMQSPILKENAKFKEEWFRYFEPEDIRLKQLNYYTTVDLASSKEKRADDVVIMTVGKERTTGFWFVVDYISGQLDPGATIDAIFLHNSMFPGTKVFIESNGYQSTLQYHLEEKQRRDLVFFQVEPLTQSALRSKEARIESLIQPFKLGMIFIRRTMKKLEAELLAFPQGKHDDHPDALSMMNQVLPHTVIQETPEQKALRIQEEREDFDPRRAFNRV